MQQLCDSLRLDPFSRSQGDLFLNQVVPKSPNKVQEEDEAEAEDRRLSKVGTGKRWISIFQMGDRCLGVLVN